MRDLRCLLFDFGGTLDADGVPWAPRFYDAYRQSGGTLEPPGFQVFFEQSNRACDARGLGFRATIERRATILASLLPEGDRVDARRLSARFHENALAMVHRNRPMLERLTRTFRLGIVSNFTGNLRECIAELLLDSLFAVVIDSGVVGVAKPDRAIFLRALSALGSPCERAVFIGDNPEHDVRPASDLGMATCWIAPPGRPLPRGLEPTHRIASLLDLEWKVA